MARHFWVRNPDEGVYHIRDALGAHMTLLIGRERALLLDTGYGLWDVAAMVRTLTRLPLTVVCTHAHADHVLGCRWFEEVWLAPSEVADYPLASGRYQRERVLARSQACLPEFTPVQQQALREAAFPTPRPLVAETLPLGGLTATVLPMPGHTPSSIGLWVPEARLWLPGDNFNPVTWLFFANCAPLDTWADTLRACLGLPFTHALCPHAGAPCTRRTVERYVRALSPALLASAQPISIPPYDGVDTVACNPIRGYTLVVNRRCIPPPADTSVTRIP